MNKSITPEEIASAKLKHVGDATPLNEHVSGVRKYLSKSWSLLAPFWQSPETRLKALTLSALLLALELISVSLVATMSFTSAAVLDTLDSREFDRFWIAFRSWIGIITIWMGVSLANFLAQFYLKFEWREFLTKKFLKEYLSDGRFHQMALKPYGVDNPDQRIAADINAITANSLDYIITFVRNVATLFAFGWILWSVSGDLSFSFLGIGVIVPGYMLWIALVYAIIQTWLVDKIARPLVALSYQKATVEADFRHHLIRVRENTESIALLGGESKENAHGRNLFQLIRINWFESIKYNVRLLVFNATTMNLSTIVPYFVALPALISGSVGIGGLVQLRQAWGSVEASLSWFANSYAGLAGWKAGIDRVLLLEEGLNKAKEDKENARITHLRNKSACVEAHGLSLDLPNGETLLEKVTFSLKHGQNVIITGTTGSGKSTLFRALSGHWIWGAGEVSLPYGLCMFLPQRPYIPNGQLRAALTYPNDEDSISDDLLRTYLESCQLNAFVDRLYETGDWSRTLSGGEQQRLSLVRACVAKPDWLFLDEATSAMDPETESRVYEGIKHALPETTIVSIAHRDSLKGHHQIELLVDGTTRSVTKRHTHSDSETTASPGW